MFEKNKPLEKAFLDGYKKYGNISKKFEKRKKLYYLLLELSSLSFSCELGNKKWRNYNLKKIKKILNL